MPADGKRAAVPARRWGADAAIALALLIGCAYAATAYSRAYDDGGGIGQFYRGSFDVAVMDACGKGFVRVANPVEVRGLAEFLDLRSKTFDCRSIPIEVRTAPPDLFQAMSRYMMKSAAVLWRWRGVSWAALQPLFALAFAATALATYALMRVVMRPWLAGIVAAAFASSGSQFNNLPHLRDYLKAPFVIGVLALAAWIATARLGKGGLWLCSAAAGAVVGIGFGFRTDLLLGVPAVIVAIWISDPKDAGHWLRLKCAATVLFLTVGILSAFPLLRTYSSANNSWHVTILGLMTPFDEQLAIAGPFYSLGHFYNDTYANAIISSYATNAHLTSQSVTLGSTAYDAAAKQYWLQVVLTFPADVLFRIYAAALEVINLPFRTQVPEFVHHTWILRFYTARAMLLGWLWGVGPALAVAALMGVALVSLRLMAWWTFAILYFAGTPAMQFEARHYFHLEVIGWLVLGFMAERALRGALALRRSPEAVNAALSRVRERAGALIAPAAVVVLMFVVLAGLRAYQTAQVRKLIRDYQVAPKDTVAVTAVPQADGWVSVSSDRSAGAFSRDPAARIEMEYLVAEIAGGCQDDLVPIRVRYDASERFVDFSETLAVVTPEWLPEPVRVYIPVYYDRRSVNGRGGFAFSHLEMRENQVSCLRRLDRIRDFSRLALPLFVTLRPGWATERAYQSFGTSTDVMRIVSAPEFMSVPGALFRQGLQPAFLSGVEYKARIVERLDSEWVVSGRADGAVTYLGKGRDQTLQKGALLLGSGKVEDGGFAVGLQQGGRWVRQLNISHPGSFRLAIEVPEDGAYALVLANYLPRWRTTSFRFDHVGWLLPPDPNARWNGSRRDELTRPNASTP